MDAYIYGERRPLPEGFAAYHDRWRSAVVSIDMHQGHLADTPDCPCPAPRARELVAPIDAFHDQARGLGVPIIHVRTILRKRGVDDVNGLKAAWRLVFPLYAGKHPRRRRAWNRGNALDRVRNPRRGGGPDGKHQEAVVGVLSDRS